MVKIKDEDFNSRYNKIKQIKIPKVYKVSPLAGLSSPILTNSTDDFALNLSSYILPDFSKWMDKMDNAKNLDELDNLYSDFMILFKDKLNKLLSREMIANSVVYNFYSSIYNNFLKDSLDDNKFIKEGYKNNKYRIISQQRLANDENTSSKDLKKFKNNLMRILTEDTQFYLNKTGLYLDYEDVNEIVKWLTDNLKPSGLWNHYISDTLSHSIYQPSHLTKSSLLKFYRIYVERLRQLSPIELDSFLNAPSSEDFFKHQAFNLNELNRQFEHKTHTKKFILSKKLINEIMLINFKYGLNLTTEKIANDTHIDKFSIEKIFLGEGYSMNDYNVIMKYLLEQQE